MFELLDDTMPFAADDDFRRGVRTRVRSRRRRHRVQVALSGTLVVAMVAGGGAWALRTQAGQLTRIDVGGLVTVPPPVASTSAPVSPISAPMNILVRGVDTRPAGTEPEVSGTRGDTIAVVRIDPIERHVVVLSIPRDLWVPISGAGHSARIATADASQLVRTITDVFGLPIDHYVQIDFSGFRDLVDIAGGVDLSFDRPVRDRNTGFEAEPGCVRLEGTQALAYVRSRHLELWDAAARGWITDPTGDLGRIARQQDFARRAYTTILTTDPSLVDQARILVQVLDKVTVDEGLSLDLLRSIVASARSFGPGAFVTADLTTAVSGTSIDGAAVLVAAPDELDAVVAGFLGQGPIPTNPIPSVVPEGSNGSCPAR